jgi:hypothetical protein
MAVNPFFANNYSSSLDQGILEGLVIDSIKQFGMDIRYIPRQLVDYDDLYGEDTISEYNSNYPIEMYVDNFMGFTGDQTFLSKFNLEVRDELTLVVSIKRFEEEVPDNIRSRPMEGDLIFFPFGNRVFYIKFVEHREFFYQLGKLYTYKLTCEAWEYSGEKLNTGIAALDSRQTTHSRSTADTGNTNFEVPLDWSADNPEIDMEANNLIDFSETNPFGNF